MKKIIARLALLTSAFNSLLSYGMSVENLDITDCSQKLCAKNDTVQNDSKGSGKGGNGGGSGSKGGGNNGGKGSDKGGKYARR